MRGSRPQAATRANPGFTMIEILIVIAIVGLLMSGIALGANALPRARLRTSSMRLASTFRYAYLHALTTGRTTRVSFRMSSGDLSVEDTDDAHVLDPQDPRGVGGAGDVEENARQQARLIAEMRPRTTRARFTAVPIREFNVRPLEQGVAIVRLYSLHDPEPRETGTGHVYFFAGGQTERAVVWLRNARGETFAVMLQSITGRTEVFDRAVEPPMLDERDQNDANEVDMRDRPVTETTR